MRLEELLKKEGLSSSEISELLYRINTEKQDDEKKIDMYNRAIQEAKKYDQSKYTTNVIFYKY